MARRVEPTTGRGALTALARHQAKYQASLDECGRRRRDRDQAIAHAVDLGVPAVEIAVALGVSVGRVSQLLTKWRADTGE